MYAQSDPHRESESFASGADEKEAHLKLNVARTRMCTNCEQSERAVMIFDVTLSFFCFSKVVSGDVVL
jgi:hypothetical protein